MQMSVKDSQVMKEPDPSTSVKQHHRSQTDLCRLIKVLTRHVAWSARGGGHRGSCAMTRRFGGRWKVTAGVPHFGVTLTRPC